MPRDADGPPFNSQWVGGNLQPMKECIVARNVADELRIRGDHKVGQSFEDALREAVDEAFGNV